MDFERVDLEGTSEQAEPQALPREARLNTGNEWGADGRVRTTQSPVVTSLGHGLGVRTQFSPFFIDLVAV